MSEPREYTISVDTEKDGICHHRSMTINETQLRDADADLQQVLGAIVMDHFLSVSASAARDERARQGSGG